MDDTPHGPMPERPRSLDDLPSELEPPDDLEDRVTRRLLAEGLLRRRGHVTGEPGRAGRRAPRVPPAWWITAAAAGMALFLGGFALGQARATDRATALVEAVAQGRADERAAAVQRVGSLWVTALAALAEESGDGIRDQEREVAMAALRGAVLELARLQPEDVRMARIRAILEEDGARGPAEAGTTIWF